MKLYMTILMTCAGCSNYYGKTAHIDDLTELVSESKKALVYLYTYMKGKESFYRDADLLAHYYGGKKLPALSSAKGVRSGCSAFFVDLANGYLATNQHCIDNAQRIDLELANGKLYRGEVVGVDKHTDVALLKVSDPNFDRTGLKELKFSKQKPVQGDKVVALGAPLYSKGASTTGSITTLNHPYSGKSIVYPYNSTLRERYSFGEYIQHDALIQGGNSGGPLINTDGQLLGINSLTFPWLVTLADSDHIGNGTTAYAVSYRTIEYVIAQLRESGSCKWGDIGVSWQKLAIDLREHHQIDDYPELPDYQTGAVITEVRKASTATNLQTGDIVFAINGKKITDHIDASNAVLFSMPGDSLQISFIRSGKVMQKTIKVSLWHDPRDDRPVTKIASHWGLKVAEIDQSSLFYQTTKQEGLLVISDSNFTTEMNIASCYLVSVDGQQVTTIKGFAEYLKGKEQVALRSLCFYGGNKIFYYSTLRKS